MTITPSSQPEGLLACPCCGSDRIIPPPAHWTEGCVYCRSCGLRANSPSAWNTRATPAPKAMGEVDETALERLQLMARQKLPAEMDEQNREGADWQGGYKWLCRESRLVLAALQAQTGEVG